MSPATRNHLPCVIAQRTRASSRLLTNLPPCHGACHSVCRWRRVRKPHLTQNAAVDTELDGAGRDAGKRTGRFLGGAVISIAGDALALVMLLVCDAPALTPVTDCPVSCPTELADYKGSQLQQEFDLEGYTPSLSDNRDGKRTPERATNQDDHHTRETGQLVLALMLDDVAHDSKSKPGGVNEAFDRAQSTPRDVRLPQQSSTVARFVCVAASVFVCACKYDGIYASTHVSVCVFLCVCVLYLRYRCLWAFYVVCSHCIVVM